MRRRRVLGLVLALAAAAALVVAVQPTSAFTVLQSVVPGIVFRVETGEPLVALTFDDGPSPTWTPRVLDLLALSHARATFFLIGERAAAHPALVARIRAEGHEVGNHSLTDGTELLASEERFLERLTRTEQILELGTGPRLYRPPGALLRPSQLRLLGQRGYTCVLGSAYPYDPHRPPPAYMRALVTRNMVPGAIVVLHDGIPDASRTLAALPGILEAARRKGLRLVTLGELLASARPRRG